MVGVTCSVAILLTKIIIKLTGHDKKQYGLLQTQKRKTKNDYGPICESLANMSTFLITMFMCQSTLRSYSTSRFISCPSRLDMLDFSFGCYGLLWSILGQLRYKNCSSVIIHYISAHHNQEWRNGDISFDIAVKAGVYFCQNIRHIAPCMVYCAAYFHNDSVMSRNTDAKQWHVNRLGSTPASQKMKKNSIYLTKL